MTQQLPSVADLWRLFAYDAFNGRLYWEVRPREDFASEQAWSAWNTKYSGTLAGSKCSQGYIGVTLNGKRHKLHRIIFKMVHGSEPPLIDHIDGDRSNNYIMNLRAASFEMNSRNRRGPRGVRQRDGMWIAQIKVKSKAIHLGSFYTMSEAVAARRAGESRHWA